MASIDKRVGKRGISYYVRYRDPSGGQRNQTFTIKREAEAFSRSVEVDMARQAWVDPNVGRETFTKYAARWLTLRQLRPRTVELYRGLLANHLEPAFGTTAIAAITPSRVREWHAAGNSPITTAKAYRLLRAILNTAVEDELIVRNPCVLKGGGVERSAERPTATAEQVWQLADAIEPRFRAIVVTAGFLGLRWGELAGLARRHVNLLHGRVTVERQLVETKGGRTTFGPPKTEAGVRTVSLPDVVRDELELHLEQFVDGHPEALVFVGAKGAPLTRRNFHAKWSDARDVVEDLPDGFTFHDLRHTANTLAAATGASTRELMHRLGHASPAAALRYQHATQERDEAIAEAVSEAVRRSS